MRSLMTKFLVAVDDLICVYLRDFNFQSYKLDKNTFIRQLSFHFNDGPGQTITVEIEPNLYPTRPVVKNAGVAEIGPQITAKSFSIFCAGLPQAEESKPMQKGEKNATRRFFVKNKVMNVRQQGHARVAAAYFLIQ